MLRIDRPDHVVPTVADFEATVAFSSHVIAMDHGRFEERARHAELVNVFPDSSASAFPSIGIADRFRNLVEITAYEAAGIAMQHEGNHR